MNFDVFLSCSFQIRVADLILALHLHDIRLCCRLNPDEACVLSVSSEVKLSIPLFICDTSCPKSPESFVSYNKIVAESNSGEANRLITRIHINYA